MTLRPGPLQEIPLELLYTPPQPNPATKRLHSPPSSPAKRRILAQDRFSKSSRLSDDFTISARKLDFGTLPNTKTAESSCCSRSFHSHSPMTKRPPSSSRGLLVPKYKLVSREMPPPCDPNSIHYPGFTIYCDPHVPVYEDDGFAESFAAELAKDKDGVKENSALLIRKKVHKNVPASGISSSPRNGDVKTLFMSPQELERLRLRSGMPSPRKQPSALFPPVQL